MKPNKPDFDYAAFRLEVLATLRQYPDGHIEKVKYMELLEELKIKNAVRLQTIP